MKFVSASLAFFAAGLSLSALSAPAFAHFPFIAPGNNDEVVLFFGENLSDRAYKMPPAVEKAVLWRIDRNGDREQLKTRIVDSSEMVGLVSEVPMKPGDCVVSQICYGIYRGSRLDYYCAYCSTIEADSNTPNKTAILAGSQLELSANLKSTEKGIQVHVSWKGQPLPSAKITLSSQEGQTLVADKTDSEGTVIIPIEKIKEGVNALLVGHKEEKSGELDGQSYKSAAHYLTITFRKPEK